MPKTEPRKLTSMRLPETVLAKLQSVSALTGRSQSDIVVEALDAYWPTIMAEHDLSARLVSRAMKARA